MSQVCRHLRILQLRQIESSGTSNATEQSKFFVLQMNTLELGTAYKKLFSKNLQHGRQTAIPKRRPSKFATCTFDVPQMLHIIS